MLLKGEEYWQAVDNNLTIIRHCWEKNAIISSALGIVNGMKLRFSYKQIFYKEWSKIRGMLDINYNIVQ